MVKTCVDVPVAVHCHNDFGLSLAGTIASLKEGADIAHVTVNGLGEKSGNTDIAELALALKGLYNVETNLKFDKLIELSKLVERLSNIKVSTMKPVVGDMIFTRESGLVVAEMINHPPSVEGYSPELLGRKRSVALGKKSGKKSIEYVLNELNINLSEDKIDLVLEKVKNMSISNKGTVNIEEFKKIIKNL